jgi:hypothetical protein
MDDERPGNASPIQLDDVIDRQRLVVHHLVVDRSGPDPMILEEIAVAVIERGASSERDGQRQ